MDFVFDRVATGRALKCLTIVDDATHEVVDVAIDHSMSGRQLTRVLDRICAERGYPGVIRADNGPEFTGKALMEWADQHGVTIRHRKFSSYLSHLWFDCGSFYDLII